MCIYAKHTYNTYIQLPTSQELSESPSGTALTASARVLLAMVGILVPWRCSIGGEEMAKHVDFYSENGDLSANVLQH